MVGFIQREYSDVADAPSDLSPRQLKGFHPKGRSFSHGPDPATLRNTGHHVGVPTMGP